MTVEGKVARVLTEHDVAFSAGNLDGVRSGDTATVYRTYSVPDPDTGLPLGDARLDVARFRVYQVGESFSVGRVTDTAPSAGLFSIQRQLMRVVEAGELSSGMVQIGGPSEPPIPLKRGDLVRFETPPAAAPAPKSMAPPPLDLQ